MFFKNKRLLKEAQLEIERLGIENGRLRSDYSDLIELDEEIAKRKMPDLNTTNLESAVKTIEGTAKSMGLTIEG